MVVAVVAITPIGPFYPGPGPPGRRAVTPMTNYGNWERRLQGRQCGRRRRIAGHDHHLYVMLE